MQGSSATTTTTRPCLALRLLSLLSLVLASATADVRPLHVRVAWERVMDSPGMNLDQDQKVLLARLLAAIGSSADEQTNKLEAEANELNHSEASRLPVGLVARALRAAAAAAAPGSPQWQLPLGQRERKAGCKNFFWKTFSSC